MRRLWLCPLLIAIALAATPACGKKSGTNPTPTVTGLSITPATDLIKIKANETFTVTATFSDGTSSTVQGTWSTDAASIATVDSTGRVTGVAPGQATIAVDHQGQRATRGLRVVPDYHGRWEGGWTLTGCTDNGDLVGICGEYTIGDLFGLTLVANQTRDSISGTVDFGDKLPGAITGAIQLTGHLVVSGTYTIVIDDITFEITVTEWRTITLDNERMTGDIRVTLRVAGLQGSFTLTGTLHEVSKTSAIPSRASAHGASMLARAAARVRGR